MDNIFKYQWEQIQDSWIVYKLDIEKRIVCLLRNANFTLRDFFVSQGFDVIEKKTKKKHITFVYDKNTGVGIRINMPEYIDLDSDHNILSLSIVYKSGPLFLDYNKQIYYHYKSEDPEKAFKRFKKYNGNAEIKRMKNFLRSNFPKEMLISDRQEKLKKLL